MNKSVIGLLSGLGILMLVAAGAKQSWASAGFVALVFHRAYARDPSVWERSRGRRVSSKTIAFVSLVLWLGVAMAGRWIAYADYIFPPK